MNAFKAISLESALKLVSGPLAIWVLLILIRGVVLTNPRGVGDFVIGLLLGPLFWFGLKGFAVEVISLSRSWWYAKRHAGQLHD